jgi:hemolysin D
MPQTSFSDDSNRFSNITTNLIDELPKPWTRGMLYFFVLFLSIVIPWTMLYKVEETGTATGKLELKGNTVKRESDLTEAVSVVAVRAKEGDFVKAGQILVELDAKSIRDRLQQLQVKLDGQQNRLAQSNLLKNQLLLALNTQQQQNRAQESEKQAQVSQAQQNLDSLERVYALKKIEGLAPVEQAQQSLKDSQTAKNLANNVWQDDLQEVERYQKALEEGIVAETRLKEVEKQSKESLRLKNQAQFDLKQAKLKLQEQQSRYQTVVHQAKSDVAQAKLRLQEQQRSYQSLIESGKIAISKIEQQLSDSQTQIASLQSEIAEAQAEIKSLNRQLEKYVIRAPFEGTLFQFPIKQKGTVVQSGQLVAEVAQKGAKLIFKAQLPTSQNTSVQTNMPVKLKFDAYPFQDYGVVSGRLSWISPTSRVEKTSQGDINVFDVEVVVEQPYIYKENQRIELTPGQTATAEVIVRQRRVIDFILDPFKKLQNGELKL